MKIAIHQPQYMPWPGYFHKMASVDLFVVLDDVQFKKNEWQHRNRIRNSKGWQWLSVPTTYKFPQKINEVVIDNSQEWRKSHRLSLETCYGKSRFGKELMPFFDRFFERSFSTIDQLNTESVRLLAGLLGIATPVVRSSEHHIDGVSTERLVAICRNCNATTYLAGAGGHDYMDLSLFENAKIKVEFQDFHTPRYPQHWSENDHDFIPALSAIDLVFNCGPDSKNILMGAK
jgi:hypothetical protein